MTDLLIKGFASCMFVLIGLTACTDGGNQASDETRSEQQADGLSQKELERGIGPIDDLELGSTIDTSLVSQGQAVFEMKCAACHKLDERYVGPPLGDVLNRRSPEFIMNMMLNPDEMAKKHPEGQDMLAEYFTIMPDQNLTEFDARAVLEFLRSSQIMSDAAEMQ